MPISIKYVQYPRWFVNRQTSSRLIKEKSYGNYSSSKLPVKGRVLGTGDDAARRRQENRHGSDPGELLPESREQLSDRRSGEGD